MARRIDQVNVAVIPLHARGGTGDRNTSLAFEIHVVHGRPVTTTLHFLNAVNFSSVIKDALRERRLAGVNVGRNAHVAKIGQIHGTLNLCKKMKLSSNLCNSQFVRITAEAFRLHPYSHLPKNICPGINRKMWGEKLKAT